MVAVLGLDNSHPFSDAANLMSLDPGLGLLVVGNEPPDRLERFAREFPDAVTVPDIGAMLEAAPAGVLVTLRPSRLLEALPGLLRAGCPSSSTSRGSPPGTSSSVPCLRSPAVRIA